ALRDGRRTTHRASPKAARGLPRRCGTAGATTHRASPKAARGLPRRCGTAGATTHRASRCGLCSCWSLARWRDGAEVLGDLLLRPTPKKNPARLPQPGRRPDFLLAHHLRDLRAPAEEVLELHHHLAPGRLVQLAADVLAGLDDHLRLSRIAADGLEQAQRFGAVSAPQAGR